MAEYKLLGISGSLRKQSYNTVLLHEAARLFDPAEFTLADLRLPLYDQDLEEAEGIPTAVQQLSDQIAAADAVVIAGPEYNKSVTGVLKNALDWVSRTGNPWADKPVALASATAGRAGGERMQFALRLCMMPFRPRLLQGPEVLVGQAADQFDAQGRLTNQINHDALAELMTALKAEIARAA
ncbi:NADPH-dependent FMN reductase [Rhodovulum adriaticum]|uniref:Chromate reductase n=1 Tax=Rhodovulum adriaticum TaxID=35804 RepID=A0A4R2P0Q9_RHOAD|nr:NAD(P)H-dependent oxidoreductase [Rhodovulum adriaticum]MBK1634960.1 NADPH-dependent FMN reductase [Rhodovulum adriaticum]TCP27431.1 chromate reductase [Rhodovulum adriaticum]